MGKAWQPQPNERPHKGARSPGVAAVFFLLLIGVTQSAEIRLENAVDGSAEITLEPGETGVVNIVLETSNIDTIEVGSINILLDASDGDVEVYAVSAGQGPPWIYDRSDFTLPCAIGGGGNEYELIMNSDDGFPFGTNTWILDSLTLINSGSEEATCSVLVTFGTGNRAPELESPDSEDFEAAPDCFADEFPNYLYQGAGNAGPKCPNPFTIHKGTFLPDCNGNGIPDECDIASGTSTDSDKDGVPDECQACEGDANGDGVVDPLDSGFVLTRFGCPVGEGDPDCDAADQNGDAIVDPLDIGFILARFGECL